MPHVIVKLWPGTSEKRKHELASRITQAVMDTLHYGEQSVSVGFEEIAAKDWMASVFDPDIQAKSQTLYKKPGYSAV